MRVLLISANTEKINVVPMPLGLNYVAAATQRKGHAVKVLDLMFQDDAPLIIREAIESFRPEVIGISVRNIDDQSMHETKFLLEDVKGVIDCCRRWSKAPIVLGGAGYSIFPQAVLAYLQADMGIQGEGEAAFPMLLERLEKGGDISGVPGLHRAGGDAAPRIFIRDLDDINVGSLQRLAASYSPSMWMPFQTRRGCPMDCSYCSTATIEGRIIRKRPVETVIKELRNYTDAGFTRIHFVDNTFNLPPAYAKALCRGIIEEGLKIAWQGIVYPAKVDEELVELMARSGCRGVSVGVESGCQRILDAMNKHFTLRGVREISRLFAECEIGQMGFLMLGGPGETRDSVLESLDFVDSLPLNSLRVTKGIRIYPHTALARLAVEEGLVAAGDNLLSPVFYMVRELQCWLFDTLKTRMASRPNWVA